MSAMGFWDFHRTADGHWQWRYVAENAAHCVYGGRFRSRNDCIADAMRHGYLSDDTPCTSDAKEEIAVTARKKLHGEAPANAFLHRLLIL